MKQYIDKSAIVAEIKKRLSLLEGGTGHPEVMKRVEGVIKGYKSILSFLDTLEVKEVDLEKEIEEHVVGMPMSEFTHDGEVEDYWDWGREEFRYFFELGLKAQKGE